MIEMIEGKIGGGKTTLAALMMNARLARGCHIFTNVALKREGVENYCAKRYGVKIRYDEQVHQIDQDNCGEFHKHIQGGLTREQAPLIVLDEVHLWFNARDWAKTSRELLNFLSQSRKVHTDIIFISQSIKNVDSQFARQAEFYWACRDMRNVRILGFRWPWNEILAVKRDCQNHEVSERMRIKIHPLVYDCFDTAALLSNIDLQSERVGSIQLEKVKPKIQLDFAKLRADAPKYVASAALTLAILKHVL
jgi:hypothetical protein